MKVKSNENGQCPFCNSRNLDYDCVQLEGDMMYYPWRCRNCSHEGEEWYNLSFAGHNVFDEEGDLYEIEPHMIEK